MLAHGMLVTEDLTDTMQMMDYRNSPLECNTTIAPMEDMLPQIASYTVEQCVSRMKDQGKLHILQWLEDVLLEACFVKLGGRHLNNDWIAEEPITLLYNGKK